jgi:SpoVK/Ycf46/Vps4 family AAA+-type ATPase
MIFIAKLTDNFSGAELEGLVKSATSFALAETIESPQKENDNLSKLPTQITMEHFQLALK